MSTRDVRDVLQAVQAENEKVGGASQVQTDSVRGGSLEGLCDESKDESGQGISVGPSKTVTPTQHKDDNAPSQLSDKTSFPLKPALLSHDLPKPSKHTKPTQTAPFQTAPLKPEEDLASSSLTEHTLRVITEKVRSMNPK